MNIKNIIRKNFIAFAAIMIILGTMSFKLSANKQLFNWYLVAIDGTIIPRGEYLPPSDCLDSGTDYCAIKIIILPGGYLPETVAEAYTLKLLGLIQIQDKTYRP